MSKRIGVIAVAACVCGLLFTGAASARQTAGTIAVKGVSLGAVSNGTYVQFFSGNGTPIKQVSLSGGADFHFSWTSAPCKLAAGNGGISCNLVQFGGPYPNFWVNTIVSGTLPASVAGTVVYGDDSTGTFTAPVTEGKAAAHGFSGGGSGVVVNATSIQIGLGGAFPPIRQFSLDGGSNWHLTAISSTTGGGSCSLTPSNGGGSCAFAQPVTAFVLNATFSGTRPTKLLAQITWSDNTTDGWDYRAPCLCRKLSAELGGFKEEGGGKKLVFFLKWKLDCAVGAPDSIEKCGGFIRLKRPKLPPGLQLRQGPDATPWPRTARIEVQCNGSCKPTAEGEYRLELVGPAAVRAQKSLSFIAGNYCQYVLKNRTTGVYTLAFDKHGDVDRRKSHLGKVS